MKKYHVIPIGTLQSVVAAVLSSEETAFAAFTAAMDQGFIFLDTPGSPHEGNHLFMARPPLNPAWTVPGAGKYIFFSTAGGEDFSFTTLADFKGAPESEYPSYSVEDVNRFHRVRRPPFNNAVGFAQAIIKQAAIKGQVEFYFDAADFIGVMSGRQYLESYGEGELGQDPKVMAYFVDTLDGEGPEPIRSVQALVKLMRQVEPDWAALWMSSSMPYTE